MGKKTKAILFKSASIAAVGIFLTALTPVFLGPGLTEAEPIGRFLNGAFPEPNVNTEAYEVSYPNLRFDWPLTFNAIPGQSRFVVGQLDGRVYWMEDDQSTATKNLLVDFSQEVGDAVRPDPEVWDGGLLGLEIHPDFGSVGKNYFYVYYSTESETGDTSLNSGGNGTFGCDFQDFHGNYLHLDRFEVNPNTMAFVPGSRQRMIRRRMLNTAHRAVPWFLGMMGFYI